MGYRSDVKIIAGKNAAKELLEVNAKHSLMTVTEGENDEWLFEAEYLKWYDEYKDVQAYMDVVHKYAELNGKDDGICFLRQGEDDSDTEYISNGVCDGYVRTEIEANDFTPKSPKDTVPPKGKRFVTKTVKVQAVVTKELVFEVPESIVDEDGYIKRHGLKPLTEETISVEPV